jgi:23S rRNA (guanosine2251-2'-O)-methyltransferase
MKQIILVAHNVRSTYNIGSLMRTSDGLGLEKVFLTGYSPYPISDDEDRLPHIARKVDAQIAKTALGAEQSVKWAHQADIFSVISQLKKDGYVVIGLEQTDKSIALCSFKPSDKLAVIVGREVEGIEKEVLDLCDQAVEIPMAGKKESFNVAQATAIFLSYCVFS